MTLPTDNTTRSLALDSRVLWFLLSVALVCLVGEVGVQRLLPYLWWRYLHLLSAALFLGLVLISSLMEERVARVGDLTLLRSYHEQVRSLDKRLITLSLSVLLGSALALLELRGHRLWSMHTWPLWATLSMCLLSALGVMWLSLDVRLQSTLHALLSSERVGELHHEPQESHEPSKTALTALLSKRRAVNIASVLVLVTIYSLMVFKPVSMSSLSEALYTSDTSSERSYASKR